MSPERLANPCRACGIPISYNGPVAATDLTLDYLRAILSELKTLREATNPCCKRDCCLPERPCCAPEDREGSGVEL